MSSLGSEIKQIRSSILVLPSLILSWRASRTNSIHIVNYTSLMSVCLTCFKFGFDELLRCLKMHVLIKQSKKQIEFATRIRYECLYGQATNF